MREIVEALRFIMRAILLVVRPAFFKICMTVLRTSLSTGDNLCNVLSLMCIIIRKRKYFCKPRYVDSDNIGLINFMDTSSQWFQYLNITRGLSPQVIKEARLSEELDRLRIPILDKDGTELFAKLRRPPDRTTGPKYTYQKGAKAYLYGTHFTDLGGPSYLTEGEIDVLAMRTLGFNAFTSTGGAMTFKAEWLDLLPAGRPVIIMFDNDDTGIKGAVKLAQFMQTGNYTWVPPMYGKDIGDMLTVLEPQQCRKIVSDQKRILPFDLTCHNHATRRHVYKTLTAQAQSLEQSVGKRFLLELAFHYRPQKPTKHSWSAGNAEFTSAIERAKHYPITNLLPINVNQKIPCLWHEEKTASLHLWRDNKLFCHGGCNKMYDAISVYMKLHNVKFLEAVDALNRM